MTTTKIPTKTPARGTSTGVPSQPRRKTRRHRRHRTGSNIIAIIASVIWIFPVYWMVNTAFKQQGDVMTQTPKFFPSSPTVDNFRIAFTQSGFLTDLKNSVVVVGVSLVVGIVISFFASAALSRFRFKGRRTVMIAILALQTLPGTALLIPQFMVFNKAGLLGTYYGLILAYIAMVLPLSIWVLRGFFIVLPKELEEAAAVDGAGTWTILWRILFPLVAPGVIATSMFGFITVWNDYLTAYVFMKDPSRYTLPVWLVSFNVPNQPTNYAVQMAAAVIFAVPVIVFFLILQRRLVAGMSAGAVKG